MGYALGVDLGTTASAAAVGRDGAVEVCSLGDRSPSIPSVVVMRDDGSTLIGDAAERRARDAPAAVAREFKRRFGDPTPLLLAGRPVTADQLTSDLLRWIVDRVRTEQHEEPRVLALAHPAEYGPFKLDMLRRVAAGVTAAELLLVPEPIAAAMKHASESRIEPGALLAVYDFGGGTFDAAVVRRTVGGFELVGVPGGIADLGGADFDAAVLGHVDASLDGALAALDTDDPPTLAALHRTRAECSIAKETLSHDTDTTIEVVLLGGAREVRLTRVEFEQMIRPAVDRTIAVLERTVASAGVEMADLQAVLLVGGSSRIPLVGQLVASRTGRPILADPYPKLAVAFGAAVLGLNELTPTAAGPDDVTVVAPPATEPVAAAAVVVPAAPPDRRRRALVLAGLGLIALGVAVWLVLALRDRDGEGEVATNLGSTSTSVTSTSSTSTTSTTSTTTTSLPPDTAPETTPTRPTTPPTVTVPPAPVLPTPSDLQVGQGGGSGEVSVTWLGDANPPVAKYQVYRVCVETGGGIQEDRVVNNVQDEFMPEGRRGFFDFVPCGSGQVCYQVAGLDAFNNEGPRTDPACF